MGKVKKFSIGLFALLLLLPLAFLMTGCGEEPYKMEYGTYKAVGFKLINSKTNEETYYDIEENNPTSIKYTGDIVLNSDGTASMQIPLVIDSYTVDSEGRVSLYYQGEDSSYAYFEGDVLYYYFGHFKSSADVRDEVPDEDATFYDYYILYTLNGEPLPDYNVDVSIN